MQKLKIEEAEQRLKKLEDFWTGLKKGGDHKIHVEFAHFSSLDFFKLFEKYAVKHADSLGMNEQELILLLDYWEGKLEVSFLLFYISIQDILMARDSRPTLNDIIDQLSKFFRLAR